MNAIRMTGSAALGLALGYLIWGPDWPSFDFKLFG